MIRELVFANKDARPQGVTLHVTAGAIPHIMQWYGAFYSGDDYKVFVDGKEVTKDINGNLVGDLP